MTQPKAPLVLLHGWAGHCSVWNPVASRLSDRFEVMNLCLPGYGGDIVEGSTDPETVSDWLRDRTPRGATWLVWSAGTLPVLRLACGANPHVARLNAVAPVVCFERRRDWPFGAESSVIERFRAELRRDVDKLLRRFARLVMNPDGQNSHVEGYLQSVSRAAPTREVLESGLDMLAQTDYRALLEEIDVPVTIFHGDRDKVVPTGASQFCHHALRDGCLNVLEGAGHAPFITDPNAFLKDFERHGRY
jgi:pimeloyl-[acyl-carrier protein] methyl ester esterase